MLVALVVRDAVGVVLGVLRLHMLHVTGHKSFTNGVNSDLQNSRRSMHIGRTVFAAQFSTGIATVDAAVVVVVVVVAVVSVMCLKW